MAVDKIKYAIGNSASTTLSASMSDSATSASLTSDTNFAAKSGEGMVIIDEGQATEELSYATGKTGASLTIPLANRGLEGGSPQAHDDGASVKGIFSALMWNDLVDSLTNLVSKTTGALDTTKVVDLDTAQTLESKTLTAPIMSAAQFTTQAYFDAEVDNGNSSTADTITWTAGNKQKSTLTDNCTFTFTAPSGPCNLILKLIQDGTGSRTVTWPATVKWPAGTAPTLTTTAAGVDLVSFYWDGTNYFGQTALAFAVPA